MSYLFMPEKYHVIEDHTVYYIRVGKWGQSEHKNHGTISYQSSACLTQTHLKISYLINSKNSLTLKAGRSFTTKWLDSKLGPKNNSKKNYFEQSNRNSRITNYWYLYEKDFHMHIYDYLFDGTSLSLSYCHYF